MRNTCGLLATVAMSAVATLASADPSKPIQEAMNTPATVFDVYVAGIREKIRDIINSERDQRNVLLTVVEIIERSGLDTERGDPNKDPHLAPFNPLVIDAVRNKELYSFFSFDYEYDTDRFALRLMLDVPSSSPLRRGGLSYDDEEDRKNAIKDLLEKGWRRVGFVFSTHPIREGWTNNRFDAKAFRDEVTGSIETTLEWGVSGKSDRYPPEDPLGKALATKGIRYRTYRAVRSPSGKISISVDDRRE